MGITGKILNKIGIIKVVYSSFDDYSVEFGIYNSAGHEVVSDLSVDDESSAGTLSKMPVLLLVGGYGVIEKDAEQGSDTVTQITSDDKFSWNNSGDDKRILFVRKEQIRKAEQNLEARGIKIIQTICFNFKKLKQAEVEDRIKNAYKDAISLKNILRPTKEGCAMAMLLFGKIKIVALIIVLLLLITNFMVSRHIGEIYFSHHQELISLQKRSGLQETSIREQRVLVEDLSKSIPYTYSWLGDKIGSVVPKSIILNYLGVQPQKKALEYDKAPDISAGQVVLRGEAAHPQAISDFVSALNELNFSRDVRLTSLDKEKETGNTVFRIDITL